MSGTCGAVHEGLACDREHGHAGEHRGWRVAQDCAVFWPSEGGRLFARLQATDAAVLEAVRSLTSSNAPKRVWASVEQIAARAERTKKQVGLALFRLELRDKIVVDRTPTGRATGYWIKSTDRAVNPLEGRRE